MANQNNKYLFTITHYDSDADRVATPLVLANNALAAGGDVLLWLTVDGAKLGKRGSATGLIPKSFPPVEELLSEVRRIKQMQAAAGGDKRLLESAGG